MPNTPRRLRDSPQRADAFNHHVTVACACEVEPLSESGQRDTANGLLHQGTPAEIAAELVHSLDFLETELRDLPERQRSMRAVFDYSWRLLSGQEQTVFQQLTVFRGGFTRKAAETVAGASLRMLMGLINKRFLLQATP